MQPSPVHNRYFGTNGVCIQATMTVEKQFRDVPRHSQTLIFKMLLDDNPLCYFHTLSNVCTQWHDLVREAVKDTKSIRTLEYKQPSNAAKLSILLQMLPHCRCLETLDVTALYVAGASMDPRRDTLHTLSQHCPCLHTLILDSSSRIVTAATLQRYLDSAPKQLATLSLNSCPDIVQDGWPLQNMTYLTRLELKWCHDLVKLPTNLNSLIHLNIAGCAALPAESKRIGLEATNLQHLNFAFFDYPTTTSTGLADIFKGLKDLRELVLAKAVGNVWATGRWTVDDLDALKELLPEMAVKIVTT